MGVGGGSGGGGFKLEKTWRAEGTGTTTLNAPGNVSIPFGKYEITVAGRAGSGNPPIPGNVSGSNPPYGGNLAGYVIVPGNYVGENPYTAPVTNYPVYAFANITGYRAASGGNPTGVFNPPSPGNEIINPAGPGSAYATLSYVNVANPGNPLGNWLVKRYAYVVYAGNQYNAVNNYPRSNYTEYFLNTQQNTPTELYNTSYSANPHPTQAYNPPTPGNENLNPYDAGEYAAVTSGPKYEGVFSSQPPAQFFTSYQTINTLYGGSFTVAGGYMTKYVTYALGPGSTTNYPPPTPIYNPSNEEPVFNPYVEGTSNFNPTTPGNPGTATNVLGVYFPPGAAGALAPYVNETVINRYAYPDDASYPVTVPSGGQIVITKK